MTIKIVLILYAKVYLTSMCSNVMKHIPIILKSNAIVLAQFESTAHASAVSLASLESRCLCGKEYIPLFDVWINVGNWKQRSKQKEE